MIGIYYVSEKPDYTILFTGTSGVGKSTAGNFFLKKKAFQHKSRLIGVTKKSLAAISTICDKTVKIIDTPGLLDGFTPTEDNCKEISRALTFARDGIHAVAFVMSNIRYDEKCYKAIETLLSFDGLKPFLFILLTHAENEGVNQTETDKYIEETLSDEKCPPGLTYIMQIAKKRVIMVESYNQLEDYYAQKSEEFITTIENIHKANGYNIYTNIILHQTAILYEQIVLRHTNQSIMDHKMLSSDDGETSYFERLTEEIMSEKMKYINESNLSDYLKNFVKRGCLIGTIFGLGTKIGGKAGGYFFYEIGRGVHSFKKYHCSSQ